MELIPYVSLFFLGAVIASFAAVVAERIHTGEPWVSGRSKCNSCGKTLRSRDLVPLVSWLSSGGRCRSCGSKIPAAYLLFEGVTGLVFALAYAKLGAAAVLVPFLAAVAVLAFIVLYDLRHTIVPRTASSSLILLSLVFAYLSTGLTHALGIALITASAISGFFLALHVFSRGRAMGLGDAPVAFGLSVLMAPYALSGVLFSFWIGAAWGIGVLVSRRGGPRMGIEVPFVPFLAAGYLLAYFIQWNPLAI